MGHRTTEDDNLFALQRGPDDPFPHALPGQPQRRLNVGASHGQRMLGIAHALKLGRQLGFVRAHGSTAKSSAYSTAQTRGKPTNTTATSRIMARP